MLHRTLRCLSFTVLAAGCMPAPLASTGPQHVEHVDTSRIQGSFVPAGARLGVRMEEALDTSYSARGERFSAVVTSPLRDPSGRIIVASGAHVFGHVEQVTGARGPRLRLHFETIETVDGVAPLQVRIAGSDVQVYSGPPTYMGRPFGYDSWYGSYYGSYPVPVGGGPISGPYYGYSGWYGYDVYIPREVHLRAGAVMNLELTRPLLPPGARTLPQR